VVGGTFLVAVWSWGPAFYGLGVYLVALGRLAAGVVAFGRPRASPA
jgi:hypothetical protein